MQETSVRELLRGVNYSYVPKVELRGRKGSAAKLDDAQVIEIRRRARSNPDAFKAEEVAAEFGMSARNLTAMLYGSTYKHVPDALDHREIANAKRKFLPEVVLFMRLAYRPKTVSFQKIGDAFGIPHQSVAKMITGGLYEDVPCAIKDTNGVKLRRRLSDEECRAARRKFRTRWVPLSTLATDYQMSEAAMLNMIRGRTYKDVPDAVPEHIKPLYHARAPTRRASARPLVEAERSAA
jgi:AraC-like DNA-binding protein